MSKTYSSLLVLEDAKQQNTKFESSRGTFARGSLQIILHSFNAGRLLKSLSSILIVLFVVSIPSL